MENKNSSSSRFSFTQTSPNIINNARLREPQRMAAAALDEHFDQSNDPALVQIPVGCGKTGLISLLPFTLGYEQVLVVTPNLTIREALRKRFNQRLVEWPRYVECSVVQNRFDLTR